MMWLWLSVANLFLVTFTGASVNRQQWGKYDIYTDYYDVTPDTGRTVEYYLTVDNVTMAPDGVERLMMVYNNQFPGPPIVANWGDWIVVHVTNNLKYNGTSVHWHGLLQKGTGAMDGVPGITQCPIPPGHSFTYRFRATTYGTTWYHSHFSLQYSEGLVGPLLINGPTSADWDVDLGAVILQDWYHTPVFDLWFKERQSPGVPADNSLINGKNKNGSVGEYSEFKFQKGKKYRMRIVNTSTDQHFKFSIDNHVMTVQQADFVPIVPYTQTVLSIAIGQRYDVIFEATEETGNYWMRAVTATGCSGNANPSALAIVRYGDDTSDPTTTPYPVDPACNDEQNLVPVLPVNAGSLAYGNEMDISVIKANYVKFTMNGSSLLIDWSNPTLMLADKRDPNYPESYNVVSLNGTCETWTYFVIQSVAPVVLNHPIHMHGHDFLLLAKGAGVFNESVLETAQFQNPTRRDVTTMPISSSTAAVQGGYIVVAFQLNNPGVWAIHCHIAFHLSMGLGFQFVERLDDIPGNVGVTDAWEDNCEAWIAYDNKDKPEEDDSGI